MQIWWMAWGALVQRLLALAGSVASLVGVLIIFLPRELPWWAITLLASSAFFLAVLVFLEVAARRGRHVFAKADSAGIKGYLHDWIEHGGRVAIWTRDMSWAHNAETRRLLLDKAGRGELILCLPESIELSRELAAAGAEVCSYGAVRLESPASRFTIAFFGRGGSRVAVGHEVGHAHVIDEFEPGQHPAFYLAEDLVALVRTHRAGHAR